MIDDDWMVQAHSEINGLLHVKTLADAFNMALVNPSIWKISFSLQTGERVRLIKYLIGGDGETAWIYEPII